MIEEERPEIVPVETTRTAWEKLQEFTPARIGLGRTGHSQPTKAHLEFQLAHAKARDAVYTAFDPQSLAKKLAAQNFETILVESNATEKLTFLRYPDKGRRLAPASRQTLLEQFKDDHNKYAIVFVLGDGLSAEALHRHAIPVLNLMVAELQKENLAIAPIVIASGARVALGDEIGEIVRAEQVAIFIGERPGLTSPDSMSIYLTYDPKVGRLESERNCISNIRPEGLNYTEAAETLLYFLHRARSLKLSGVQLKDERDLSR
jgi:ethanolamine ammonia-lyase small subunit